MNTLKERFPDNPIVETTWRVNICDCGVTTTQEPRWWRESYNGAVREWRGHWTFCKCGKLFVAQHPTTFP